MLGSGSVPFGAKTVPVIEVVPPSGQAICWQPPVPVPLQLWAVAALGSNSPARNAAANSIRWFFTRGWANVLIKRTASVFGKNSKRRTRMSMVFPLQGYKNAVSVEGGLFCRVLL